MKTKKRLFKTKFSNKLAKLLIIFLILLLGWQFLKLFINKEDWTKLPITCPAIANNLVVFAPPDWKALKNAPIYDGPYNPNPVTQEEIDFNNLTSQCQIIMGFPEIPAGYQFYNPNNLAHIILKADRTETLNGVLNLNSKNSKKEQINHQTYLVQDNYFKHNITYQTIINKTYITIYLHVADPGTNPKQDAYFRKTLQEFLKKLVVIKVNN